MLLWLGGAPLAQVGKCGDIHADNYSPAVADADSSACAYPPVYFCSDPAATNYESVSAGNSARVVRIAREWACTYSVVACKEPVAANYWSRADEHNQADCVYGA
jgi:hypothetical protein